MPSDTGKCVHCGEEIYKTMDSWLRREAWLHLRNDQIPCRPTFAEPAPPSPSIEAPRVETIRCTHCANQVAVKEEGGTSLIEAHGGCPDRLVRGNWRDDPTYQRIFPEPEDKQ